MPTMPTIDYESDIDRIIAMLKSNSSLWNPENPEGRLNEIKFGEQDGGESAKFSDNSTMKANTGKKIGVRRAKVITGSATMPRTRTVEAESVFSGAPIIDGSQASYTETTTSGAYVIIDFGSVATANLHTQFGNNMGGSSNQVADFKVEISDDNVSYTAVGTFSQGKLTNTARNHGEHTWRYVKVTFTIGQNTPIARICEIWETSTVTNSATIRIRSSTSQDGINGSAMTADMVVNPDSTATFPNLLYMTGNGEYVTLEIVSFAGFPFDVELSEITSIKET